MCTSAFMDADLSSGSAHRKQRSAYSSSILYFVPSPIVLLCILRRRVLNRLRYHATIHICTAVIASTLMLCFSRVIFAHCGTATIHFTNHRRRRFLAENSRRTY